MSDPADVPVVNSAVLSRFRSTSGTVPSGYYGYFLGNLTQADVFALPREERARYDCERREAFSDPTPGAKYRRIDDLQLDVQGVELDVLSSGPGILDEKVKRVNVGRIRVNDVDLTLGDGVQVWINPAL